MAKKKIVEKNSTEIKDNIDKDITKETMLDKLVGSFKKKFGDGVIITPKDCEKIKERIAAENIIKTDSISFNSMTGTNGLPRGRIYLLSGSAGCGKTHTSLACYKSAEKEGYTLLYVDAEHRLDIGLVDSMKINRKDAEKFILVLPNTADEVFEIIDKFLQTGKKFFIILDSITALNIKNESKKAELSYNEGRRPGQTAKSVSEFFPVITPALSKSQSILFILSQQRMKNIVGYATRGTTGGLSVEYYATYILNLRRVKDGEILKDGQEIGQEVIMDFSKTTTSLPPQPRKVALAWGKGFYLDYEIVKIAIQKGIVIENGHWYSYKEKKYNSLMNLVSEVEQNKELFKELKREIEE